jgi:hypothetical protein
VPHARMEVAEQPCNACCGFPPMPQSYLLVADPYIRGGILSPLHADRQPARPMPVAPSGSPCAAVTAARWLPGGQAC